MAQLTSKYGMKAEERAVPNIPEYLSCAKCGVAIPKTICKEEVADIDTETLANLAKSSITNFAKEFRLRCPTCSSQIYGILLEE